VLLAIERGAIVGEGEAALAVVTSQPALVRAAAGRAPPASTRAARTKLDPMTTGCGRLSSAEGRLFSARSFDTTTRYDTERKLLTFLL
jgi:hypothetical protein